MPTLLEVRPGYGRDVALVFAYSGLISGDIAGLPTSGEHALGLSTGDAGLITEPNDSSGTGVDLGGPANDEVLTGPKVTIPKTTDSGRTVTLVVTDNRGLTDFEENRLVTVDVKPGSTANPVKLSSKGATPVALLTTPDLDATRIDPGTVTAGPAGIAPVETVAKPSDVDGDGDLDQVLHFTTRGLGLTRTATQLCVSGNLTDGGESLSTCDGIRAVP